ncbi:Uncharacterised protein [Metamycoplasma cloacale]|uniref:Uncharacterized protein n=1 Tax=Metamycoplasma cloacale TaxID=92401 RepID=A0A2Z4LMW6_9BACT|nr:hypothetical protein [Metamycoplasma cloacale]AWX42577.1 hypothetical protein DK849_00555 [Metamycoplasma cloacale]VEU79712.1 Uncharacterised protein [Metamycoplasma cloacale]
MELLLISHYNIKVKYQISQLQINNDLEDTWYNFKPHSLGSYKQVFFRIILTDNTTLYFILKNVFISNLNNEIVIRFSDKFSIYKQSSDESQSFIENKRKLSELKREIKYYKAINDLDISNESRTNLTILESKLFELMAIVYFNLEKQEDKDEK